MRPAAWGSLSAQVLPKGLEVTFAGGGGPARRAKRSGERISSASMSAKSLAKAVCASRRGVSNSNPALDGGLKAGREDLSDEGRAAQAGNAESKHRDID